MELQLRPATPADFDFLWQLHQDALKDYIAATWGWDDEWQETYFVKNFRPDEVQIMMVEEQRVGMAIWREGESEIYLAEIQIVPAWQNRGLGSAVLQFLLDKAREASVPLRLQVLFANPRAQRLYERLGLRRTGDNGTHYLMSS